MAKALPAAETTAGLISTTTGARCWVWGAPSLDRRTTWDGAEDRPNIVFLHKLETGGKAKKLGRENTAPPKQQGKGVTIHGPTSGEHLGVAGAADGRLGTSGEETTTTPIFPLINTGANYGGMMFS